MKILFINHKTERCGVADYGRRLYFILKKFMDIDLCEAESQSDINLEGYDTALYNYHYATLPFISSSNRKVKHVALFHEAHLNFSPDVVINVSDLPRPLFEDLSLPIVKFDPANDTPVIGSFGFGFPDKNFPGICEMVKNEFDEAIVSLNIPFAEFGDKDGKLARNEVMKCIGILRDSKIGFEINHEFLSQTDLLQFLNSNDINIFNYAPSHGRGISSCTDYALSVKKPIGISGSEMFRHLPREICLNNTSIKELIGKGIEPLKKVYEDNSNEKLVEKIKSYI